MVGCDGRNWHQRIADYRLYADAVIPKHLIHTYTQCILRGAFR
jgi:hypothetical protein